MRKDAILVPIEHCAQSSSPRLPHEILAIVEYGK